MKPSRPGNGTSVSFRCATKINPFDLALLHQQGATLEESELNQNSFTSWIFRVVMGKLTPTEDALLDRALILTYKQKAHRITTQNKNRTVEDLYKTLIGMEEETAKVWLTA